MTGPNRVKNSQGKIWYGMHMYPGVAQYEEGRIYLSEDIIRNMGPSFAGRPVFVEHVDDVSGDIDELKREADGWVVESFFNQADGKHWVKFITTSSQADRAIQKGLRLSNCYLVGRKGPKGTWNNVDYEYEVLDGEYEHLAIVSNPRYDESVIMSHEEFKAYNDSKVLELKRLANDKSRKGEKMKFKFFKRAKVENSVAESLEETTVVLPKSGVEVELTKLINDADEVQASKGKPKMANASHLVEVDGEKITVEELVKLYNAACKKNEEKEDEDKKENEDEDMENEDDEDKKENEDEDTEGEDDDEDVVENEDEDEDEKDDKAAMKKAKDLVKHEEKELSKKNKKKKNAVDHKKSLAKRSADRLRHANERNIFDDSNVYDSSEEKVARGKRLFGS